MIAGSLNRNAQLVCGYNADAIDEFIELVC